MSKTLLKTGLASFGSAAWSRPTTSHSSSQHKPVGITITGTSVQKPTTIPPLNGSFAALTGGGSFRLPKMSKSLQTGTSEPAPTLSPVLAAVAPVIESPTRPQQEDVSTPSRWAHRSGPVRGSSFKAPIPSSSSPQAQAAGAASAIIPSDVLKIARSQITVSSPSSEPSSVAPSQQRSPQMAHRTLKVLPQQTANIRFSDDIKSPFFAPARPSGDSPYSAKPELKIVPIRVFAATPKSHTAALSSVSPWSAKLSTSGSSGKFEFPEASLVDRLPAVVVPMPKPARDYDILDDCDDSASDSGDSSTRI
jgi:hypothetical protein